MPAQFPRFASFISGHAAPHAGSVAVIAALLSVAPAAAQTGGRVIELFTSQGCSSCPPADRLMGKLAKEPETIVLSLPVDYWDYIGWKDTFASPAFTARQKAYARARGDGAVYTPQAVIDGLRHAVGSDATEIDTATQLVAGEQGAMRVTLKPHAEKDRLVIDVDGAPGGAPHMGAVWIFHIARARSVAIGRGENAGHTVTYTDVVRGIDKVGDWMGEPKRYEIANANLKRGDADDYVLILQAGAAESPGVILGATKAP